MKETVRINGLTLCHKGSDGLTVSTLHDVCRSPSAPVPYVNVAYACDLADGSITVFSHGGKMCGVRGSRFAQSFGDEPGVGRGIKSQTVRDEATWLSWSPNVYLEERAATRLSDRMLMNKGNAASLAGYQTQPLDGDDSEKLLCDIGCMCYASLRPRNKVTEGIDAIDQFVAPVDEDVSPGRYQRCVEATLRARYPNTVLDFTVVGENYVGNGYLPEVGFWDPLNPANTSVADKPPGKVILDNPHGIPHIPRRAPWQGYKWFSVRGSRWMDVVRVENGQMTEMYDMKFPGDRPNVSVKDRAYREIARRHRASYDEFNVLDMCDQCEDAIDDYERQRQLNHERTMRDIGKALRDGPKILPPVGPGGRIPRPRPY